MPDDSHKNLYALILGLPQEIDEPNHYELLGIPDFTQDGKVVHTSSMTQYAKLMSWQNNNEHFQSVKAMMAEVVEARNTLLDEEQLPEFTINRSFPLCRLLHTRSKLRKRIGMNPISINNRYCHP